MTTFMTTGATLRAVLCFIDPQNTPKIAFDNDELAIPLINKIKEMVGEKDGSQPVFCRFGEDEQDLLEQYQGCCKNMSSIFKVQSL